VIRDAEVEAAAVRFGVAEPQIQRDHLISHLLAAIANSSQQDMITFFGGTALCRTWLPELRLSEDVDLLIDVSCDIEQLRRDVSIGLRRQFPAATWEHVANVHDVDTWELIDRDLPLKVQFAQWRRGWEIIPVVEADVALRYSDLNPTCVLRVPSTAGFSAMRAGGGARRHPRG